MCEASQINVRNHQGFDYYAPVGTDVLSVKDGTVVQIVEGHKDYGTSVTIEHTDEDGNTVYSFYAHLSEVDVNVNETMVEGQVVAKSGTSGNAENMTGKDQHLHFELRDQKENAKGLLEKEILTRLLILNLCLKTRMLQNRRK